MLARLGFGLTVVSIAAAFAACSGRYQDPPVSPDICGVGARPPSLIYPIDGARNIPDGNFVLVVDEQASGGFLAIGGAAVTSVLLPAAVPSPLPSPSASSSPGFTYGYAVPPLQAATTYQVMFPIAPSGCFNPNKPPSSQPGVIGTFTTT